MILKFLVDWFLVIFSSHKTFIGPYLQVYI